VEFVASSPPKRLSKSPVFEIGLMLLLGRLVKEGDATELVGGLKTAGYTH
jgi:cell division septation protein DedD